MTRRAPLNIKPVVRPFSTAWPPECLQCATETEPGWRGEPNDAQSPYIACHGDPTRHIREGVRTA